MDSPESMQTPPVPTSSFPKKYLFIILGIIVLLIIGVFIYLWQKQLINFPFTNKTAQQNTSEKIIAKVGNENIYQKDIVQAVKDFPTLKGDEASKAALNRLVSDSIILQGAVEDKMITENQLKGDYQARKAMVQGVVNKINNQSASISGTLILARFYNPMEGTKSATYDKDKETIKNTVTKLYNQVKNKQITIEQAGTQLKKDPLLIKINKDLPLQTIIKFQNSKDTTITINSQLNNELWQLPVNGISALYLNQEDELDIKYQPTGQKIDGFYIFGTVNKKTENQISGFSSWFKDKQQKYEVKYF